MLKYKNLMLITIISIGFILINDIIRAVHNIPDAVTAKFLDTGNFVAQLLCIYTLVVVLQKQHEAIWRMLPFYGLLFTKIMAYYVVPYLTRHSAPGAIKQPGFNSYIMFFALTGLIYLSIYVFLVVCCFTIKNNIIARYFKIYCIALLLIVVLTATLRFIMGLVLYLSYGKYLLELIAILPTLAILLLHYNLHLRYEAFKPGDSIITIIDLENIPQGTMGTIEQMHPNSNYYEVEFLDDKGNLLNVLPVSADNFEHAAQVTLEDRVDSFGEL